MTIHKRACLVAAAIALVAAACTSKVGERDDATTPTARSPAGEPSTTDDTIDAEQMRLVGNVPGTDGSFAFWGDLAVVNRWEDWRAPSHGDGFVVLDVSDPASPTQLSRFRCTASYADISIWNDLVFLSQDETTAGDDCDAASTNTRDQKAFAGIRVISIADPEHPVPVAAVPTGIEDTSSGQIVRGSHTHTLVPDLDHTDEDGQRSPRILVYAAHEWEPGTAPDATIVEVPLQDPAAARVVGTIDNGTRLECHDISVFMPRDLMACAAYEAGVILFDISDPVHPVRLSRFVDPHVEANQESHHSTAFSNDGNTLVLDAEIYTDVGVTPCAGGTSEPLGALWFYDIADPRAPKERGSFQISRPTRKHFCYAHESNVVPMDGPKDVVATGWFGGGVNLVDFTDPSHPREIAFWVSSAREGEHSFAYAAYWYNGYVYAGNTALPDVDEPVTHRGFDVFEVDPSLLGETIRLTHMNAQTQEPLPLPSGGP
ncbi:MAG TPA: hypothetical protein VI341_05650 [Actinomycetota bacterium]